MKMPMKLVALTVIVVLCGCSTSGRQSRANAIKERAAADVAATRGWFDQAAENGVIAQHTLYPWHFEEGAAKLNPLGEKDLRILARHYKQYPSPLNVRRGSAPDELYQQRVKTVTDYLQQAGVNTGAVAVADGSPGGDGMASEQVIAIMNESKDKQNKPAAPAPKPKDQAAAAGQQTGQK